MRQSHATASQSVSQCRLLNCACRWYIRACPEHLSVTWPPSRNHTSITCPFDVILTSLLGAPRLNSGTPPSSPRSPYSPCRRRTNYMTWEMKVLSDDDWRVGWRQCDILSASHASSLVNCVCAFMSPVGPIVIHIVQVDALMGCQCCHVSGIARPSPGPRAVLGRTASS